MSEVFNNFAAVTLSANATSGATSLTVAGAYSSLSASGNYRILVDAEILIVTARSGNTLTVERGQEGTSAVSHSSGAQVLPIVTAGALTALALAAQTSNIQEVASPGTFAAAPGMSIYVDPDTVGGNVTIQPAGVGAGQSFSVKVWGTNTGGYTVTVEPMSGGEIENMAAPGTLTNAGQAMVMGQRLILESRDGTNLYY
jgi:hypothetical protein